MNYSIDLNGITTRLQFQEEIVKNLPLPEYYGRTLDALYDVLAEQNEPCEIIFSGFEEFLHRMPGFAEAVKHMCEDVMAENPQVVIRMPESE